MSPTQTPEVAWTGIPAHNRVDGNRYGLGAKASNAAQGIKRLFNGYIPELNSFPFSFPSVLKDLRPTSLHRLLQLAQLLLEWPTEDANCFTIQVRWKEQHKVVYDRKQVNNYLLILERLCGPLTEKIKHGLSKRFLPQAKDRLTTGIAAIRAAIDWHRGEEQLT